LNRRMPNGTYGGVRGELNFPYSIGGGGLFFCIDDTARMISTFSGIFFYFG